jgi:hypothetical protein
MAAKKCSTRTRRPRIINPKKLANDLSLRLSRIAKVASVCADACAGKVPEGIRPAAVVGALRARNGLQNIAECARWCQDEAGAVRALIRGAKPRWNEMRATRVFIRGLVAGMDHETVMPVYWPGA